MTFTTCRKKLGKLKDMLLFCIWAHTQMCLLEMTERNGGSCNFMESIILIPIHIFTSKLIKLSLCIKPFSCIPILKKGYPDSPYWRSLFDIKTHKFERVVTNGNYVNEIFHLSQTFCTINHWLYWTLPLNLQHNLRPIEWKWSLHDFCTIVPYMELIHSYL